MSADVAHVKRALRAELRERRRTMTASERDSASERLTANLRALAASLGATRVAAYLSLVDEPDTRPFLAWACDTGIDVLLPISRVDGLLDWAPFDAGAEQPDAFGMPSPTTDVLAPNAVTQVDLIVVPAASVDRAGMRMGWGRGYFDKTLGSMQRRPPVYAVLFDSEFVDEVPSEVHDQPVDGVVTPSGIHTISSS